jgi:hypothetical protein
MRRRALAVDDVGVDVHRRQLGRVQADPEQEGEGQIANSSSCDA